MTRIILKPAGAVIVVATVIALAVLAYRRGLPPISVPSAQGTSSMQGELLAVHCDTIPQFDILVTGSGLPARSGVEPPADWGANLWESTAKGEIYLAGPPETGAPGKAFALRTFSGRASVQLFYSGPTQVAVGAKYMLTFRYRTTGTADGVLYFLEHAPDGGLLLPTTRGVWRVFQAERTARGQKLDINFQNKVTGKDDVLYVKDVSVTRLQ